MLSLRVFSDKLSDRSDSRVIFYFVVARGLLLEIGLFKLGVDFKKMISINYHGAEFIGIKILAVFPNPFRNVCKHRTGRCDLYGNSS